MENSGFPDRTIVRIIALAVVSFSILHFTFPKAVSAQDDSFDTAPPPLKIVSREERKQLEAEVNLKDRTKLALQFMNVRLGTAEKLSAEGNFDAMFRELGFFHALVDDSVAYLERRNADSSKVLDTLKKLEIGLRGYLPRLENIRRETPARYEDYVRKVMKFVREARARAIDPMFGDTVIKSKTSE